MPHPIMTVPRLLLLTACCVGISHADDTDWLYTVQPGDTLWSIARTHLSSLVHAPAVQRYNAIRNPYALQPASKLRIPLHLMRQHASSATVSDLVGQAMLDNRPLTAGQTVRLQPDQVIRTGANSAVKLLLEEGSLLSIGPSARLVVRHAIHYPSTRAGNTWLNAESGSVDNSVVKNPLQGNRHVIQTPSAITAVRGTAFRVNIANEDSASTEVVEGSVAVSAAQAQQSVPAGFGSVTRRGAAPGGSIPLPPAPDLSPLQTVQAYAPAILQWQAADGMSGYQVNLMRIAPERSMVDDRLLPQAGWRPMLGNGHYQLAVRSQLPNGLQGYPARQDFTVHAHPAPPLVVSPQDGSRLRERSIRFRFSGNADSRYRVQLFRDSIGATPALSWELAGADTTRQLPDGGRWLWRVARLDPQGQAGPYSQPYTVHTDAGLWRASYPKGMQLSARPYPLPGARYQLQLQLLGRDTPPLVYNSDQPLWQDQSPLFAGRYRASVKVSTADGYLATEVDDILNIE